MYLLKTAFLEIKGRLIKTLILFFVFLVLFSGMATALTLLHSAEVSKKRVLENIGASVTLDYADMNCSGNSIFTQEILDRLISVEDVVGVNQNYAEFASPINFQNSKLYIGKNPYLQKVQIENDPGFENNIILEGNIRTDLIDCFRNGAAEIVHGSYPTELQPGALISSVLAEENNLSLNDELVFRAYGKEASIRIVGIYNTRAQFQITSDNIIGKAAFAYSPFNRIYVDIESFAQIFSIDQTTLPINVYIDSPAKVQETGKKIKSMDFNWDVFRLVNTTATEYSMAANSIESISRLTKAFIFFFSLIIAVVLIIIMSIWAEAFQYESGIYLSLGASKWRAIMVLLISAVFIAVPAAVISVLSSKWFASLVLRYQASTAESTSTLVRQFITGIEMDTSIVVTNINLSMCVLFFATIVSAILLACILPTYAVLKLKPREILSQK